MSSSGSRSSAIDIYHIPSGDNITSSEVFRAVRALLQALQVARIIAVFPAIEGPGRDTIIATGETGIVTMRMVVIGTIVVCAWLASIAQVGTSPGERPQVR